MSESSKDNVLEGVSRLLQKSKENILRHWADEVRTHFPSARNETRPALYNAIPSFLDEIAQALSPATPFSSASAEVCREHGEQRANVTDLTLKQVIQEYELLQKKIFEFLELQGPIPIEARDIILHSIAKGMSEAAFEYARIQDSIREQFVAIITHDLRNPLSAVKMSIQTLPRTLHDPNRFATILSRATIGVMRIENMLQDLLDTFQLRAGKPLPIHVKTNDLRVVAREAVDELSTIYGNRFIFKSPDSVLANFCSDGIRRAIENLGTNAVKYGDPEKPITLSVVELDDRVLISVHNFGNPLVAEEQARLFKPYHRAPFAQVSGKRGWGLGLTLVQGVAIAHEGNVSVQSSEEEGTTFTINLPKNLSKNTPVIEDAGI